MKVRILDTFPVEGDPTAEEAALRGQVFETTGQLAGIELLMGIKFPEGTVSISAPTEDHIIYPEEYEIVDTWRGEEDDAAEYAKYLELKRKYDR